MFCQFDDLVRGQIEVDGQRVVNQTAHAQFQVCGAAADLRRQFEDLLLPASAVKAANGSAELHVFATGGHW
jgi:hypothetical protein